MVASTQVFKMSVIATVPLRTPVNQKIIFSQGDNCGVAIFCVLFIVCNISPDVNLWRSSIWIGFFRILKTTLVNIHCMLFLYIVVSQLAILLELFITTLRFHSNIVTLGNTLWPIDTATKCFNDLSSDLKEFYTFSSQLTSKYFLASLKS